MKLIVIDMQKALMDDELYHLDALLENVGNLIEAARENEVEVIYVQHDAGPGSGFSSGDEAFEIADEVAPNEGEKVFVKTINSCFGNRDFTAYLEASEDDTLMIVGLQTNFCIDATVKSAFERGYQVIVPAGTNSTFDNPYMNGETTCAYYFNEVWPDLFADCVSLDEALEMMKRYGSVPQERIVHQGELKMEFIIDEEVVKGHDSYLKIMRMIAGPAVDVSSNADFQKAYSGYYFPSQIKRDFRDFYFSYMQQLRERIRESRYRPSFEELLRHIYDQTGAVHYSFASKLLHTVDSDNPVLDKHILRLLGYQLQDAKYIPKDTPDYQGKKDDDAERRIEDYCNIFNAIRAEYKKYEHAPFMTEAIRKLDDLSPAFRDVSYMKKVDMLLFRLKAQRSVSVLDYLDALSQRSGSGTRTEPEPSALPV